MPFPQAPTPDDHRLLDAYLARVRALSAADWGRLDAIGARLADHTPWARLRRARLDADRLWMMERVVPRAVVVGGAAIVRGANDAGRWIGAQPAPDPLAPPRRRVATADRPHAPAPSPDLRAAYAWMERQTAGVAEIRQAVRAAPAMARAADGGAAAAWVLELGFDALWHHASFGEFGDRAAIERLYAVVEPVIPRATLDGRQPRLPTAAR